MSLIQMRWSTFFMMKARGIIDIAVKLYAIVQIEAITNGVESFCASDIHKVAEKNLALLPMLDDALRSGDRKRY